MLKAAPGLRAVAIFEEMRRRHRHLGIARGAGRATTGLVTLEDLVEQLVGDIRDESDRDLA